MSYSPDSTRLNGATHSRGPTLIAFGLTLLLASTIVPAVPAVTAMAIVAWGATQSSVARFGRSPALATVMLVHGGIYLSLYATFVCAVLYAPASTPQQALGWPAAFDLAMSVVPMSFALQAIGAALQTAAESRQ
jgi:hypothetical protein